MLDKKCINEENVKCIRSIFIDGKEIQQVESFS